MERRSPADKQRRGLSKKNSKGLKKSCRSDGREGRERRGQRKDPVRRRRMQDSASVMAGSYHSHKRRYREESMAMKAAWRRKVQEGGIGQDLEHVKAMAFVDQEGVHWMRPSSQERTQEVTQEVRERRRTTSKGSKGSGVRLRQKRLGARRRQRRSKQVRS